MSPLNMKRTVRKGGVGQRINSGSRGNRADSVQGGRAGSGIYNRLEANKTPEAKKSRDAEMRVAALMAMGASLEEACDEIFGPEED